MFSLLLAVLFCASQSAAGAKSVQEHADKTAPKSPVKKAEPSKQVHEPVSKPASKNTSEAAAPPVNNVSLSNTPVQDKWALVVGISKFADSSLNLKFASKDAKDFYDYLTTEGNFKADHVQLLLDEEATRESILDMFGDKWLPHAALPGDLVVIYISSHGSPAGMDVGEVNYIIAHNTDKERLFSTGVSLQELIQLIKKRVHSDRVIAILDTCYSGAAGAESKAVLRTTNIDANEIAQGTGQMVICSSEPNQTSWESKSYQNSVFTHQLIEGLRLKGNNTTLEEAFNFMKQRVQEEVVKDRGALQTPVLRSRWQGDKLILAVAPASPRTAPLVPRANKLKIKEPIKQIEEQKPAPVRSIPVVVAAPTPPPPPPHPPTPRRLPNIQTEGTMSWETWSARMQAARTQLEADEDKDAKKAIALLKSERDKLGSNDPRIFIAERKNQIRTLEQEQQNSMPASCRAYLEAGRKYFSKGDFVEGEGAFKSAIKEIENRPSNQHTMASCLDGLALCLLNQGKVVPAVALLRQATALDASSAPSPCDAALRLEHYCTALYVQRKFNEAATVAKQTLACWEKELGSDHPQVSRALNLLAASLIAKKDFSEAELLIKRAIEIDDAAAWFNFPDKSQGLYNLALVKIAQDKNADARPLLKQALSAREKLEESSSATLFGILSTIASNEVSLGRKPDAESSLRRILSIGQKQLKADNPYLKSTAAKLIVLYKEGLKPQTQRITELTTLYPDLTGTEKNEELRLLFELPPLQLTSPFKIPDTWNVHLAEKSGELYGRWTWDSAKKQFMAAWDNGDYGVVKVSRYDRERSVLSYNQVNQESSGKIYIKQLNEYSMLGSSSPHELLGKYGKWEAYW